MKRARQVLLFLFLLVTTTLWCLVFEWPEGIWIWICDRRDNIKEMWRCAGIDALGVKEDGNG